MNILSVSKTENEAVIRLDSTELVALCNVLYQATKDDNVKAIVYQLYDNLMIARDLSQYGHIDGFCLNSIIKCREKIQELKSMENKYV